ncbi:MAG: putative endonuclease [Lentimonas sp.]|jgi:putative endonuclease
MRIRILKLVIWSIYILRCGDGTLYTGVATDVARRFEEHRSQGPKAAKYVRGRLPLQIVYTREVGTRSEAQKEEWRVKRLTRAQKDVLVAAYRQNA